MSFEAVAIPYDTSASAFYFDSPESFEKQIGKQFNRYGQFVEEFEIDLVDGDNSVFEFNKIMDLHQSNVSEWFEYLEIYAGMKEHEQAALMWLVSSGIKKDIGQALESASDVCVFEGTPLDYAYEVIADCYNLPEIAEMYFDYKAFARDLEMNGEIVEFGDFVITNPYEF